MADDGPDGLLNGLRIWAEALGSVATPERGSQLIDVLRRGDRGELENLLGRRIFQFGGCIDIIRTLTAIVNYGPGHFTKQCHLAQAFRPFSPSQTKGSFFEFPDGTINYVTDAQWWAWYDRAGAEPEWAAQNEALLVAVGILTGCEWVWNPEREIVSISQTIPICFPTVVNPYAVRGRPTP